MDYPYLMNELNAVSTRFVEGVLHLVPNAITSLLLFLLGLGLAYTLRCLVRRLIRGLDHVVPSRRLRQGLLRTDLGRPAGDILGSVVFWLVLLVFLAGAAERLGLPVLSAYLSQTSNFLPSLLSGLLIVFAGIVGGLILRDIVSTAASSAGLQYAPVLGKLTQTAVVVIGFLIGVDQLGLNVTVLADLLVAFLGAVLFAGALAFGLGARTTVNNILASHYLQKTYTVGHDVRVGDFTGEIVEITPTSVILEAEEGRVLVPARMFSELVSILITPGR